MAVAGIAVSVSMGALKPVLEKLATLLGDKYKKLKGLEKEVSFLMEELSDMKILLEDMDNAEDELNSQAKKWRKDIIDMSYDIEDCIDNFMDRVGDADDKVGILKKASHYLRTIKDRYRIANQINEIKTRVIEASKRRDRYNLNVCTSSSTTKVAVDPRLTTLYKDSTTLVGIDTQKEELVKWVKDEEKQLQVMPIVGLGGLGKTTLANEVYHEVKGHFNSKAFVSVSQKPDVTRLLSSVCLKLGLSSYSHACEVQDLVDTLREYLHDKRYLIVLDDLWEVKHWDVISCAFPKNSQQSRLIVTTRIEVVAQACRIDHGRIHYMKPLSDEDSRKLFFRRTFRIEDTCPPQFTQVSSEILKKCGGLPLAIVTMASTLADKTKEQWDYIQCSMVTDSAPNALNDMMRILDLSYKNLPHHLRACFLYLGIYPEDYKIRRDDLINLWVAERIVMSMSPGQDVKDVAGDYFNELVKRNMIQPESYYYKVHDIMLYLILKRCREDNFLSVVHNAQVVAERQDRVHRLSVSFSGGANDDTKLLKVATNCCRSQVRSLVSFGTSKWMPPFSELKSLRVLYLEFPENLVRMDLTGVGQLPLLRYFKIEPRLSWKRECSERSIVQSIQINEIGTCVIEGSKCRDRYNLNVCSSSSTAKVDVDPRLSALYKDSTTLVGIDTQKEKLVKWVEDEEKQLKVLSIVGFGGLGKTTLANMVYHDVKLHFDSMAFVPVSQKPYVPKLLSSVCSKLGLSPSSDDCEALIETLREYLHDKRYFIVLDDLWEVKHWDIISCAFPRNSQQSRLIVTTRIEGVAQACRTDHGHIHYMQPLSDLDSRKLFFRRIFGMEDTCPPRFTEVSSDILKKCGGLPLAIVTMASTLASQPIEQWEYIHRSILTESAANSLDDMMHILDLSYKHLPSHLRACFLYLGIYPEDYEIQSDGLIELWVAERIVTSKFPGQDVKYVAESYLNELVNRNMLIQQEYDSGCYKVHDMMLEILKRCREDNFISVGYSAQVVVEHQDRVHQLPVNLTEGAQDGTKFQVATNCCQSTVRSFVSFGGSRWMPPMLELKYLQVLYLEFPEHLKRTDVDLTGVDQLSQLRYLRIEANSSGGRYVVLPSKIRRMRHLERLELPLLIDVANTPSDIVDLPCLSHLSFPFGTSLMDGIGKMKSLRTLEFFTLALSSPENIKGLGELNKLEELRLECFTNNLMKHRPICTDDDTPTTIWMDALIFSLEKLSNLKCFWLMSISIAVEADALLLFSPPFHNLETLWLPGLIFSRVPRWIEGLQKLRELSLGAKQMPQEDIDVIGTLPVLSQLWLWIPGVPTCSIVIGGATGFNALQEFMFDCDVMSYLAFEDGAMPSLRELQLRLDPVVWDKATPLGLQYLSSLKEISVWMFLDCSNEMTMDNNKNSEIALMRRVFQEAADAHPSYPAFSIKGCWPRPREEAQE